MKRSMVVEIQPSVSVFVFPLVFRVYRMTIKTNYLII